MQDPNKINIDNLEGQELPFFARFLENQIETVEDAEAEDVHGGRRPNFHSKKYPSDHEDGHGTPETRKYPSDREDAFGPYTNKYPSDQEDTHGGPIVTAKAPSDAEDGPIAMTLKYPSDGEDFGTNS
jgi:hypothetical protein